MQLTLAGKGLVLLVVCGAVVGAYRLYTKVANDSGAANASGDHSSPSSNHLALTIQASGTYQDFLERECTQFRQAHPEADIKILSPKESRDALHAILESQRTGRSSDLPDIWLASNDALVQSLSLATKRTAQDFANVNDTRSYMIWPPQPMVILTKASRQAELAQLFAGRQPLEHINGKFRYSFPDPLTTGGGHTALGYCDWQFRHQTTAKSLGAFLTMMGKTGYVPLAAPSGGLASDFPSSNLDFIFLHNALADREIAKNPQALAKVIPAVTTWERPSAIGLHPREGWSAEKQKTLFAFIEFLRQNPPYMGAQAIETADVPDQLDLQKQIWERTFDQGARSSNINQAPSLPVHP